MGSLIVRNVDDALITRPRRRAASLGRSSEAEHREILRQVLSEGSSGMPLGDLRGKIRIVLDFDETPDDIISAQVVAEGMMLIHHDRHAALYPMQVRLPGHTLIHEPCPAIAAGRA